MSKALDNKFMIGMIDSIFKTVFKPLQIPNNFYDLLDINRRKVVIEFDRTFMKIDHDVITFEALNSVQPDLVVDAYRECREKMGALIEETLPEYGYTMMYFEGDSRCSERGAHLMELGIDVMISKMLLMSQMNIRFSFSPEHVWIELIKKDPKAVFQTHSSLIIYPNKHDA